MYGPYTLVNRSGRAGVRLVGMCLLALGLGLASPRVWAQAGSVDTTFNPGGNGANAPVYALALQANGRILVGGGFTRYNTTTTASYVRLATTGLVDGQPLTCNGPVYAVAVDLSNRAFIAGGFTSIGVVPVAAGRVARLSPIGMLDTGFSASASGDVMSVAVVTNGVNQGKVLIGGWFYLVNSSLRPFLARLNANGTLDAPFGAAGGPDGPVYAIAIQPDAKILIGGDFNTVDGVFQPRIARLNSDGSLDPTFDPGMGADASVFAIALQPDGKIVIGGLFTDVDLVPRQRLARLNADGSLDTTFLEGMQGVNDTVQAIAIDAGGRILVGGSFTEVNGLPRNRFARLDPDGALDSSINLGSGADNFVSAILVQPDGDMVLGGGFTSFNGVSPLNGVLRLNGGAISGSGSLAFSASTYTVNENAGQAIITVRRTGGLNGTVGVRFATTNGTATAGVHYLPAGGLLTFAPGQDEQTFAVTVIDDDDIITDKTVDLVLSDPESGATLGNPARATLSIVNEDGTAGFKLANYLAVEGSETAAVTIERLGGLSEPASVELIVGGGSATIGQDYTGGVFTVSFEIDQSLATVDVSLVDDTLVEPSETVFLTLTNPVGPITLTRTFATLTIFDNDFGPGTIEFASEFYSALENEGAVPLKLVRRAGVSGTVSVRYETIQGTARAGLDYVAVTNTIAFAPGETVKAIPITLVNDPLTESNETFTVRLLNPTGGATLGRAVATVRIADDEYVPGSPGQLELDAPRYTVREEEGALDVKVRRIGGTNGAAYVTLSTVDGTATGQLDFRAINSLLFFDAGEVVKTVTIPILNDTQGEGNEQFQIQLSAATNAVLGQLTSATVTILEDDLIPGELGFAFENYNVYEEDGDVRVTVARTNGLTGPVSAVITTADDTAVDGTDYFGGSYPVSFEDGQRIASVLIPIGDNGETNENRRFLLTLGSLSNATDVVRANATVTILDDDYEDGHPGVFSFESVSYVTNESAWAVRITIVRQYGRTDEVELAWETEDGSAVDGFDYVGSSSNTVTFGDNQVRRTITIPLIDNTVMDGNRFFNVVLLTNGLPAEASLGTDTTEVLITDDDQRWGDIRFVSLEYSVSEGGTNMAAITVARYGGNFGTVTVDYYTSDGTAVDGRDYQRAAGTLILPPTYFYQGDDYYWWYGGEASYATFYVPINDDTLTNGARTVVLSLANVGYLFNNEGNASLSSATATLTIYDDESELIPNLAAGEFGFSSPYYYQTDREGYYWVYNYSDYYNYGYGALVTVTRTNGSSGRAMVDYEVIDPLDPLGTNYYYYIGLGYYGSRGTLVFDDYQMSTNFFVGYYGYYGYSFQQMTQNYHLVVQLSNPRGDPGEPTPTLSLLDTAVVVVYSTRNSFNFVNAVTRVPEWAGRVWLAISRPLTNVDVTVEWEAVPWGRYSYRYDYNFGYGYSGTLQAGSDFALPPHGSHIGDYTPVGGTLTWGRNDYSIREISIPITDDDEVEFNEDFFVYLRIPDNVRGQPGEVLGPVSVATVTILADDVSRLLDDEITDTGITPETYRNEQPAGAVDITWNRDRSYYVAEPNPRLNNAPGANNRVYAMAVQPDGKILLGGEFTGYNAVSRNRIARTDAVGGIDLTFNPGTGADDYVAALDLYRWGPNKGKIIVGGGFTSINGQSRFGIARLNDDGSLDPSFQTGSGANGPVRAVALENDGRVIIAGDFTEVNGTNRNHIARLNLDGSLDTTFNPGFGANGPIYAVALSGADLLRFNVNGGANHTNTLVEPYTDGILILDCDFETPAPDSPRNNLRVYYGGAQLLDTSFINQQSFELPFSGGPAALEIIINEGLTNVTSNTWSYAGIVVPLGTEKAQIVAGGDFTLIDSRSRSGIARLSNDGSLDLTFDTGGGLDGIVYGVAVQDDHKVLMGGDFTQVNLESRNGIARLNPDGKVDVSFRPGNGFDDIVYAVELQPDGKLLVGGIFKEYDGTRRMGIARLFDNGLLDTSFMDAAYNQFAGVVNVHSYDPPSFVSSVAHQVENGREYVYIAGSFTRVGGGYIRNQVRYRSNVARLIGGETPGPGNLEFTLNDYGADESGSFASFTLRRVNGRLGAVAVDYVTGDVTAIGGDDYTNTVGTAYWGNYFGGLYSGVFGDQLSDGDNSPKIHQISLINDSVIEGEETFSLTLTNPASTFFLAGEPIPLGAALGESQARFNIIDDDFSPGVLGFSVPTFTVNENAVEAVVTVIRTNGAIGVVTVNYATEPFLPGPNSATLNADYHARQGTLSFASGQTNLTFTVPVIDDTGVEFDESIRLRLSLPTGGATLGLDDASLIIIDNDFLPGRLNFTATNFVAIENGGAAVVTVGRSGGNLGLLTVQVSTTDGTALAGQDYLATTNTLVWNDGDSLPKTFTIPLLNDFRVDPDETIRVHLANPSVAGALGLQIQATVTITDDDRYGTLAFSSVNFNATENGGTAVVTVIRSEGSSEAVTIGYFSSDATATNGDYTPVTGQLTFQNGELSKSFPVPILDDTEMDGTKIVLLSLTNVQPVGALLGFPAVASLTIIDDESANVPAGAVDTGFRPVPGVDGPVYAMGLTLDGRLIIGGDFSFVNGAVRTRLARLLVDGTLDATFDPGSGVNGTVRAMAMASGGKAVVGGFFSLVNGTPRNSIVRLNTGGTVDTSFNPGAGFDNPVYAVAIQRVNQQECILVGGGFTAFNGVNRAFIARLTPSGLLDTAFDPGLGANDTVFALAVQPDGKVLIGGDFTLVNNTNRAHIARLNVDGSLDLTFDPGTGPDASVRAIAVQSDGKIVLGGLFTRVNGVEWNHIARLNPDGSIDTSFNPGVGADNLVYTLAIQDDGKILVGGDFTRCNGVTRNRITRLNPDGTVDPSINFGTGANSFIATLKLQPDGKIAIGGGFTVVNGVPRNRVARLHGGALTGSGSLEFSSPHYAVVESGINSVITVRRVGGTDGAVTVNYASSSTTAGPDDYADVSGTLTFPTGETEQAFTVPVFDNQVVDANRTVDLVLSNFTGATAGPQPTATLTIVNDDSYIGFATPTFSVNENALGGRAVINVSRTGSTNGTLLVDFATVSGGTAIPDGDYTPTSGSLIFEPGVSNLSFTILIIDDTLVELTETVHLRLNNPRGAVILSQTNAVLNIFDNDFAPGEIRFARATYGVRENGGNAVITVIRTNGSAGIVSAQYATGEATAQTGFDYLAVSGVVNFADGQTVATFAVPILTDDVVEEDETISLRLFSPVGGATLGVPNTAMLIITNIGGVPTPCSVDLTFDPGTGAANNNLVRTLSLQSDGKILLGGSFTNFNGERRAYLARLNSNGSLDSGFVPAPGADRMVWCLSPQADGKVLVGGAFTTLDGLSRLRVGRLQSSGVVDAAFELPFGLDATVYAVAPHSQGTLIAGAFGNTPGAGIARLLAGGAIDNDFNVGSGLDGAVYTLLVQPDGRILIGGTFTRVNGVSSPRLARLRANGTLDPEFNVGAGIDGIVWTLALREDGKIMVGGDFNAVNNADRLNIARLHPNGSVDTAFAPSPGPNDTVFGIAVQPDGKVLIGGSFVTVNGLSRNRIARLSTDGSLDQSFGSCGGADGIVYTIALQPDGMVLVGGDFTQVAGQPRNGVARLNGNPIESTSYRIVGIGLNPQGAVLLTVASQAGSQYVLEAAAGLSPLPATWSAITTNVAAGSTLTLTDPNAVNYLQRFYRVRRLAP